MTSSRLARFALPALTAFAFLALPSGPGHADYQSAREAYMRGDFANAFALALPSALEGNPKSRIGLGLMLARGEGVKTDIIRSYSWFELAAAQADGDHPVIRILALANRDFLRKQMSDEQIAEARLRAAMMQATTETLNGKSQFGFSLATDARKAPAPITKASAPATADDGRPALDPTQTGGPYQIQLAAGRSGSTEALRSLWSRLVSRYSAFGKLRPALVHMDLEGFGVYEGLRAGPFASPQLAYRACSKLIADSHDCFVVAK